MQDKDYLRRCLDLAILGGKHVRPNPLVGAVIVYNNRIIGEGYHEKYGGPHAEVNAINSLKAEDEPLLSKSTIYVSLEPCCHYGNTPPCTDLIIKHRIPRVCIAEVDPTEKVKSKGIQKLRDHGIHVDVIEIHGNYSTAEFRAINLSSRPFVQLKFAKSKDNFMGQKESQIWLSNDTSSIFTHKLRSYTDAILVGTNTALLDNPSLTLRNYPGNAPKRILLDRTGRIPLTHSLLSDAIPSIIITENKRDLANKNKQQIYIDFSSDNFIKHLLEKLYQLGIHHLMVEGGGAVLKSFVKANCWDEAVVINTQKILNDGIRAINITGKLKSKYLLGNNEVAVIANQNASIEYGLEY